MNLGTLGREIKDWADITCEFEDRGIIRPFSRLLLKGPEIYLPLLEIHRVGGHQRSQMTL